MVEGEEDLHEVIPDGVFRNRSALALCLLDDGGEIATTAVFHKDVEDASVAVDVAVVIAYNVFVVEVLQDVTIDSDGKCDRNCGSTTATYTSETICLRSRSDIRSKLSSFRAKT